MANEKEQLLKLLEEKERRVKYNYISTLFPSTGPVRRELYPKHLEFFKAGAKHKERAFIAANRIGKTQAGLYEVACHMTGVYPDWWEGRRFSRPITACCCGVTNVQTTGVIQEGLLGPRSDMGTGMVPRDLIGKHLSNPGSPDALVSCEIKHASGGWSKVIFKSYQHDRESYQGYVFHVVFLDEEPPQPIYSELLLRTMTCDGILMSTFTPLSGLSDVVLSFLPEGKFPENQEI